MENCPRCGGKMEKGHMDTVGLHVSQPVFIVAGEPTSINPIKAFKQGLEDRSDRSCRVEGYRCSSCGRLELYATEPA